MKVRSALIIFTLMTLFASSCKKEKDEPVFSAPGYWKGNIYLYHSAILNRENGTSRLYHVIQQHDTAQALATLEGIYTLKNGSFKGVYGNGGPDSIVLEATTISAYEMSGLMIFPTGEAADFKLIKR